MDKENRSEPASRRVRYGLIGALLGTGAPVGLLILSALRARRWPSSRWLASELRLRPFLYSYLSLSTTTAFALFGRLLGHREELLEASRRELDRLHEELAAVIAHDLRNPINAILMQIDLLIERGDGSEVRVPVSTLESIQRSGRRLAQMVRDLLDVSQIEADRLSLQRRPVALAEEVSTLIESIRPTLGAHPVELRQVGPVPPVDVDPNRFDQVVVNLLENAAKSSDAETPIRLELAPAAGGVLISVADRGSGILPEDLPRLFDRFYQAKRARAKKVGLGLGLYIVKGLVEAHGGRIWVRSVVGEGSTFYVWLPISAAGPSPK